VAGCRRPAGLSTPLEAGTVSGGERRRLLLARALLVGSRVLLLDEPAEHLDPDAARAVTAELADHARRAHVAVVMVTPDGAAASAADRVLMLDAGRAHLVVPTSAPAGPQLSPSSPASAAPR
jgi:ATP-binding cassette, subfamily C, bacterial CydC